MKSLGRKIRVHMVRGARVNNQIQRMTRSGVMDDSVGIGCNEGWARRSGRGRVEDMQAPRWIDDCIAE